LSVDVCRLLYRRLRAVRAARDPYVGDVHWAHRRARVSIGDAGAHNRNNNYNYCAELQLDLES